MSSYSLSLSSPPTSGQYTYSGNNSIVKDSGSYSTLGAYNIGNSTQFTTGPPVPTMSETVVQIVPSYGGVGFSSSNADPAIGGGVSNYYNLNSAYCCGTSTCQTITTPLSNQQNVLRSVYEKSM